MRGWRIAKADYIEDLSGRGAAIAGGRWNHQDVPALYLGFGPAICCLETFVHAGGKPTFPMKIACFALPEDPALYDAVDVEALPDGWNALPADRPSMDFGSRWLRKNTALGLIVPSAVLPLERVMVVNPEHAAMGEVRLVEVYDFMYDARMLRYLEPS